MFNNKFPLEVRQHYTIKKTKNGFNLSCDDCKNDGNSFHTSFSKDMIALHNTTGIDDLIHHTHRVHPYIIEDAEQLSFSPVSIDDLMGTIATEENTVNATTTDAIAPPNGGVVQTTIEQAEKNLESQLLEGLNTPETKVDTDTFTSIREDAINRRTVILPTVNDETVQTAFERVEDAVAGSFSSAPPSMVEQNNNDTVPMAAVPTTPASTTELFRDIYKIEKLKHSMFSIPVANRPELVFNQVQENNGKMTVVVRAKDKKHSVVIGMRLFEEYKNKK